MLRFSVKTIVFVLSLIHIWDAAKYDPAPAMDEVILKDKRRLVVLNYGGGTDLARLKEAVDAFMGGNGQ